MKKISILLVVLFIGCSNVAQSEPEPEKAEVPQIEAPEQESIDIEGMLLDIGDLSGLVDIDNTELQLATTERGTTR